MYAEGQMKVLIIDDDVTTTAMLTSLLGKWGYQVQSVSDGLAGWEILQQPDSPQLVLLDWVMPGLTGPEICQRLRHEAKDNPDSDYKYLILLTGKDEKADLITGFVSGADDYIIKPFDSAELQARLHTALRILKLQESLLESHNAQANRNLQEAEIGSKIQDTLLLTPPPKQVGRLQIAAVSEPSGKIGGDFYEFLPHGKDGLGLFMGDVMGKGVPAALLGAAAKTHFVRAVNELLLGQSSAVLPRPQDVVMKVHQQMTHHMVDIGLFLTAFCATIDLKQNLLEFVDCGHAHALYYNAQAKQVTALVGESVPMGFTVEESYSQISMPISQGDILIFYSDGVTEADNAVGELFSQGRVAKVLEDQANRPPADLIHSLLGEVVKFSGENNFNDDLTCVAIKVS